MLKNLALTSLGIMGVSAITLVPSKPAQAALIYDNIGAPLDGSTGLNISASAIADDFTLTQAVNLDEFTFWAFGVSQDSDLSDSIGWAVFNDNAGAVGSLIASGTDTTATKTDTGLDSINGTNILKVNGDLGGTINLAAGTYWISFRDGAWGSSLDGTTAFWIRRDPSTVGNQARTDTNEVNPTFLNSFNTDTNFQLFSDTAPATTPEPSLMLGLLVVGSLGALTGKRK